MCFLGHPEPRGVFRTLSNIYDEAFNCVLFPQKLRHRFLAGSWIRLRHLAMSTSTLYMYQKQNYIIYFCKLKVRFLESTETSFRNFLKPLTEAFSEPYKTTKIERFAKTFNGWMWSTTSYKTYILDFWQSFEYTSGYWSLVLKLF